MRNRLHDSAVFWVALAAAVAVIGGILMGAGVARTQQGHDLWSSGWFIAGVAVTGMGVLMLLYALVLFLAHRHAEGHMCPDPDAHRAGSDRPNTVPQIGQYVQQQVVMVESGEAAAAVLRRVSEVQTDVQRADQSPPVEPPAPAAEGPSRARDARDGVDDEL